MSGINPYSGVSRSTPATLTHVPFIPYSNSTIEQSNARVTRTAAKTLAAQQNTLQQQNLSLSNSVPSASSRVEIEDLEKVCPQNLIDLLTVTQNADEKKIKKQDLFNIKKIALIATIACFAARRTLFTLDELKNVTGDNLAKTDGLVKSCSRRENALHKQFNHKKNRREINIIWAKIPAEVEKYLSDEAKQKLAQVKQQLYPRQAQAAPYPTFSAQSSQPLPSVREVMQASLYPPVSEQSAHYAYQSSSEPLPSVREVEQAVFYSRMREQPPQYVLQPQFYPGQEQAAGHPPFSEQSLHFQSVQMYQPSLYQHDSRFSQQEPSAKRKRDDNLEKKVTKKPRMEKNDELRLLPNELTFFPEKLIDSLKKIYAVSGVKNVPPGLQKDRAIIAVCACYAAAEKQISRDRLLQIIGESSLTLTNRMSRLTQNPKEPCRSLILIKPNSSEAYYTVDWTKIPAEFVEFLSPEAHKMWSESQPKTQN